MQSTMQDAPLLIRDIIRHGEWVYADKKIFTVTPDGRRRSVVLRRLQARRATRQGPRRDSAWSAGDRVATFMWNNQSHLEAYLAIPCMGAVLHTLNIRLFPEQLAYIINHAKTRSSSSTPRSVPLLAKVRDQMPAVEHIIVHGDRSDRRCSVRRSTTTSW